MTDSDKIKNWLTSMAGKNRYELQALDNCGLQDGREVIADVYDDFLMFSIYANGKTGSPFLSVPIDTLSPSIAARIENEVNNH